MQIYSYYPSLSQILLKNSFGKGVFKILAKIEMTRNENRLFGRHFETEQHFQFFLQNCNFLQPVHFWCKFHCKIPVESGFLRGFHGTPLGTNGSKSTLVT